ncbi:DMT family transporter [Pseudomonadota bacterium]
MIKFLFLTKHSFSEHVQGVLWYVTCCFISAVLTILYKYIVIAATPFQIMFIRGTFSLFLFLPLIIKTKGSILITKNKSGNCIIGFLSFLSFYTWILGVAMISASEVTAIKFLAPIIVILLAMIFLKEKVSYQKWIGIIVGFIGMLIIIRPGFNEINTAYIILLISNFIQATRDILLKKMTKRQVASTIIIYDMITSVVFSLPFVFFNGVEIISAKTFILLGIIAGLSNLFHLSKIKAFGKTDVSVVQPLDFLKLVFTAILSYFVFDQFVDFYTAFGGAIIVAGTYYVVISERLKHRRKKIEKERKIIISQNI